MKILIYKDEHARGGTSCTTESLHFQSSHSSAYDYRESNPNVHHHAFRTTDESLHS